MFALSVPDEPEPTPEPTPAPVPSQVAKTPSHDPGLGREGGTTLSGSQIKTAIGTNMGQIKACYERELKKRRRKIERERALLEKERQVKFKSPIRKLRHFFSLPKFRCSNTK